MQRQPLSLRKHWKYAGFWKKLKPLQSCRNQTCRHSLHLDGTKPAQRFSTALLAVNGTWMKMMRFKQTRNRNDTN